MTSSVPSQSNLPLAPCRTVSATPRRNPNNAMSTNGTLIRNATRHEMYWTRKPPTTGPRTVAPDVAAAQIPNAPAKRGPSNADVIRASEPGTSSAAAAPWRRRKRTNASIVGDRPHRMLVPPNPIRPIANTRLRPYRSEIAPPRISNAASTARYPLVMYAWPSRTPRIPDGRS